MAGNLSASVAAPAARVMLLSPSPATSSCGASARIRNHPARDNLLRIGKSTNSIPTSGNAPQIRMAYRTGCRRESKISSFLKIPHCARLSVSDGKPAPPTRSARSHSNKSTGRLFMRQSSKVKTASE